MKKRKSIIILSFITVLTIIQIFIVRPWYLRWGATDREITMPLPGDSLIDKKAIVSTRAITIDAPASAIWPLIVQMGQGRGGYYTYSWLENLFATQMVNTDTIVPSLQKIKVGDSIYFHRRMRPAQIAMIDSACTLVLTGGWIFALHPVDSTTTRLIVRYPFPLKNFADKLYYYPIFEPAHFISEAGMMMGIKQRSERHYKAIKNAQPLQTRP